MEPILTPIVTEGGFALRYLVGVVREGIIYTAAVDIKVLTEVLSRNAGALDVPPGIANAPG